jgi:PleD family two-component response regulator
VLTRQGERWHEVSARHCRDAASGQPAVLVSEMDVSELKEAEARASYLAMHDILTGLPNRNFVQQHYPALLQQAHAQNLEVALLCIDLDRFKNINDSLGHGFGDLLLVQMSERLKQLLPRPATGEAGRGRIPVIAVRTAGQGGCCQSGCIHCGKPGPPLVVARAGSPADCLGGHQPVR